MIVRVLKGRDGVSWVYTVESYRDEQGRPRHRRVASHGRLDVLLATDPDALGKLKARARELTTQRKSERAARRGTIAYDTSTVADGAVVVNAGWALPAAVLDRLGVEKAVRAAGKRAGWSIDVASIVSLLVCSRVVWPCSKKATVERAGQLLGGPVGVELAQVYQALDHITAMALDLQQAASAGLGRATTALGTVDYDVTNYFFHIDQDDADPEGKTGPRGTASRQRGQGPDPGSWTR